MFRAMMKSVPLLILFISCARATVNTPAATLSEPREAVEFWENCTRSLHHPGTPAESLGDSAEVESAA
jgi:hypothetical protein